MGLYKRLPIYRTQNWNILYTAAGWSIASDVLDVKIAKCSTALGS